MSPTVTIFALYESWDAAEFASDKLIQAGVTSSDISVLLPMQVPALSRNTRIQPKPTDVPGSRGVFSGALEVLAGLSMLALPGLGPLVGEGTLKAGLAGLGINAAVGNFAKYLINLGVPELEAKRYEDRLQQHSVLFTVHCDTPEHAKRLSELAKQTGGQDLCTVAEPSATGDVAATTTSKPAPATRPKRIYIDRTMHRATPEEFEDKPRS
jgi:hypothetical protein